MENRSLTSSVFAGMRSNLKENFGFMCALSMVYGLMMLGVRYLSNMALPLEKFSLTVGTVEVDSFVDALEKLFSFVREHINYRLILEQAGLALLTIFVTFFVIGICLIVVQRSSNVPTCFIESLGYCQNQFRLHFVSNIFKALIVFCIYSILFLAISFATVVTIFIFSHIEAMLSVPAPVLVFVGFVMFIYLFVGLGIRSIMIPWCLSDQTTGIFDTIKCALTITHDSVWSLIEINILAMIINVLIVLLFHMFFPSVHLEMGNILFFCVTIMYRFCGILLCTHVYNQLKLRM